MLGQAAQYNRCAIRNGRVQLQQGCFDNLPWDAETVDKILAVNVVYFFRADAAEIREARRVLRPGGMMAIYATDKSAMARWKFVSAETHRIFDHNDLVALILSGGFSSDEISVVSITLAFRIPGSPCRNTQGNARAVNEAHLTGDNSTEVSSAHRSRLNRALAPDWMLVVRLPVSRGNA